MTVTTDHPTGTSAGGVTNYAPTQDETRALSLRTDYLRTDVADLGSRVQELHDDARGQDLDARTVEKSKKSVPSLLEELAVERGMGWSDIAEVAAVSISAVRKWRKGGDSSPESRRNLAHFAAFLDLLAEKMLVEDPANWMEMDLPVGPGHYIRPIDLYLDHQENALLDIVDMRRDASEVLDELRPGWRDKRSDFGIYTDTDGQRSMRQRTGQGPTG